jgi:hypothetical protein
MSKPIRNIAAIIAGILAGSVINMLTLNIGTVYIILPPPGADTETIEGMIKSMPLFSPRHFFFPFLAHAIGTLSGGIVAALISRKDSLQAALPIGLVFLLGGIYMVIQLPSPLWFNIIDLAFAYLPMAFLASRIVNKLREKKNA